MSNFLKNTADTNNSAEQNKLNVNIVASSSSNCSVKRSADDDINVEIKKIKIETPSLDEQVSLFPAGNTVQPQFVSAAKMVVPIPEMTDEELLKYALEFERQHGH